MKRPKVSIIIVNYKSKKSLFASIDSIKKSEINISHEVIVVNNDRDIKLKIQLRKKYPNVKYIKSPFNAGYGGGNNLGAKASLGNYLLFLNPDTIVKNGAIDILFEFLNKNKKVAIVAPNLLDQNGVIFPQLGSKILTPVRGIVALSFINKLFPNNPISKSYFIDKNNLDNLRDVDAVPGSAFMIRKKVFEKVGKFDENIFLYFEESDLGKRVREAGYQIFINPKAEVIHKWLGRKKSSNKLRKYFRQSRFYYFKKHYGLTKALVVELFTRFSLHYLLMIIALTLTAFLRFFMLRKTMHFIGDHGWYYLSARDIFTKSHIPLVGIPSSVPVLRQGALFTWLLALALKFGNFNPYFGGYLTSSLGVISVILIYKLSSKWFNKRTGLISAFFAATSPLIVLHDRTPFVIGPIFFLAIIIALILTKIIKNNKKYYFTLGLLLSIIYQFELASFILILVTFTLFILLKVRPGIHNIFKFLLGITTGLTPLIIWDVKQGVFIETIGFFIWVLMKTLEGVKHIIFLNQKPDIFSPLISFLTKLIFPSSNLASLTILFASLILFTNYSKKQTKRKKYEITITSVWFIIPAIGFLVRGIYSEAYMPLIYLPLVIIISVGINYLWNKSKLISIGFSSAVFISNILFLIANNFSFDKNPITLKDRIEITNFIIDNTNGRDFKLEYTGSNDHFASGDNHYKYLLWWLGNEPEVNSKLTYLIMENGQYSNHSDKKILFQHKNVYVLKNE